jgi:hypothetical protein
LQAQADEVIHRVEVLHPLHPDHRQVHAQASGCELLFATITRAGSDSLLVPADPMLWVNRSRLLEFEAQTRLPTMYGIADLAREGGLIGYSPVWEAHYPLAADYAEVR